MTRRLRVAVDATSLLGPVTGVGRVLQEVLPLLHQHDDLEMSAFALTWRGRERLPEVVPTGMAVATRPLPARPARALWKRVDQPRIQPWTGPVDVVHATYVVPPASPAAEVVTVHDLTFVRFPEMCTADVLEYPGLLRRALRRGAWVHVPSRATGDELQQAFDVDPDRVVVVPLGVTAGTRGDVTEGRRLAGAERYVLALGTVEPRKDLPTLVEAFAALVDQDDDVHLVLAGPDGWGAADLAEALARHPRAAARTRRLGWVPEAERADLLAGATALAYPSIYEGFGFPPLEAMAADLPVVSTTAGSLPEVLGDAALLVPPQDPEALADAVGQVLHDDALRTRLVAAGRARVSALPWTATADGLADLYHRADEARR